ncbi:MAG: DMT family transporter, partial [Oscillospiraceae bacterium]
MIKDKKYLGIIYIIMSAFCFAFMNAFVRLAGDLPATQKSFFRNLVALIFAVIILIKNKIPFKCQSKSNIPALLVRGGIGTLGILCNFYAIDHLVLADASMLNKMSPFFVIVFSFFFLHERLTFFQGAAVLTAFVGSLFIIKPSFNMEVFPAFLGLIGGMSAGAAYTAVRYLGQHG